MPKSLRSLLYCLLILSLCSAGLSAQPGRSISYGGDLTPAERDAASRDFPLPPDLAPNRIKSLTVSNEEEWNLFKGLVPDELIGVRAITAVYVERLAPGGGLEVQTKNLTYITPHILANALATAGVTDAKIFITAPRPVPGLTARSGIYKCFEELTRRSLPAYTKRIAAEELAGTGSLGEKSGKEQTAVLVERVKERVLTAKAAAKPEVVNMIRQAVREQNFKVAEAEQAKLADLLLKIAGLNLNPAKLQAQLKNYQPAGEPKPAPASQPFLAKIIAFLQSLFKQLFSFAGRIFRVGG